MLGMDTSSAVCKLRNNSFIERVDPTTPKMNVKPSVAPLGLLRVTLHRLSTCDVRGIRVARDVLSTLALAFFVHTALNVSAHSENSENEMTIYSKEQASRGRDLYAEHCASCHGMMLEGQSSLPLSGATFQVRWADEKHSVGDLFYIVRTLMPYGQPATLSKREYIDIIAYVLMMNGYSAGARALPLDPAVLDSITIKPQRP
jgi:cytochrome c5